jgi:hypothetical protein
VPILELPTNQEKRLSVSGLTDGCEIALAPEVVVAPVLHEEGTIVIMEACKLSSRRQVAATACAILPAPGVGG